MRKGPLEHAAEFDLGDRRMGNDGNMWEIIQTTKGVKRWKQLRTSLHPSEVKPSHHSSRQRRITNRRIKRHNKKRKTKKVDWAKRQREVKKSGLWSYFIHDNGGRPFQVVVSGNKVSIYEQPNRKDYDTIQDYTKLIKTFSNVKKIFIGKDRKLGKAFDGNSILLQLSRDKYVYIGSWIYEFVTKDDSIVAYFSKVGNSDVPYPVALGEKNVYFMLEPTTRGTWRGKRVIGSGIVPRNAFPPNTDWEDAYTLFYGQREQEPLSKYAEKFHKMKVIKKRDF